MGVPGSDADHGTRTALRRELSIPEDAVAFAMFGKVTAEKRVAEVLRALNTLVGEGCNVYLLIVGDACDYPSLHDQISRLGLGARVRVIGFVDDSAIAPHLVAADACLCLRWPTTLETSGAWLRCLSAGRPTIISDLPHLVDVPSNVAMRVDLLDEQATLEAAMRRLANDARLRAALGAAGEAYWAAHHTMELMAADYRRVLATAAGRPAGTVTDVPAHFLDDYAEPARAILGRFGVSLDILA